MGIGNIVSMILPYWWAVLIIVVALVVAGVCLFLNRRKASKQKVESNQVDAIVFPGDWRKPQLISIDDIDDFENATPREYKGKFVYLLERIPEPPEPEPVVVNDRSGGSSGVKLSRKVQKKYASALKTLAYLDTLNNGHEEEKVTAPLIKTSQKLSVCLYREFVPEELPVGHEKLTPSWLGSGLDWSLQAQELQPQDSNKLRETIKIGLAVAVIVFAAALLFLIFVIAIDQ